MKASFQIPRLIWITKQWQHLRLGYFLKQTVLFCSLPSIYYQLSYCINALKISLTASRGLVDCIFFHHQYIFSTFEVCNQCVRKSVLLEISFPTKLTLLMPGGNKQVART